MRDVTVTKQELVILLNQLPNKINVDYPLSNDQIFSAEANGNHYELETQLESDQTLSDSDLWDSEKPTFSDYRQCFLASNLITYTNIREFIQEHRVYSNLKQKVVYALDTNLFYNQFLSTGILKANEILQVETVQKEIMQMLNKKFNPNQISELKQTVRYQKHLLDMFINGRRKKSRIVYNLALQEYQQYANQVYATVQTRDLVEDQEENDMIFVEAVKQYRNTSSTYPVVLTCDRILTDLCDASGLPVFFLDPPKVIHPETSTPEQLCHLLCNLAGVLGVIQINNLLMFGEYRGKRNVNEYNVRFLSGETSVELERDLEICRELLKLNIDR